MENSTHSAMLVAWSPMRSRYFAIIRRSMHTSPSSRLSAEIISNQLLLDLVEQIHRPHHHTAMTESCKRQVLLHKGIHAASVTILTAARAMSRICILLCDIRNLPSDSMISAISACLVTDTLHIGNHFQSGGNQSANPLPPAAAAEADFIQKRFNITLSFRSICDILFQRPSACTVRSIFPS